MMKCEFEKLIGHEIDSNSYSIVEYVYNNHPAIDEVDGKQQIADLYKIGGMVILRDMVNTARESEKIRNTMLRLNILRDQLNDAQCALYRGDPVQIDVEDVNRKLLSCM